jgi:hypothetical protein
MTPPVYEFRPLPGFFRDDEVRRYANGEWIPDDGEYDLAFIGWAGAAVCLYFDHPYSDNLACSWLTTHWSERVRKHPDGNPWHRATVDGRKSLGKRDILAHDNHPNARAGSSGMRACCKFIGNGCANGRHIELNADDEHIASGLVRNAETKEVLVWPADLKCVYCGAVPPIYGKTSL